MKNKRIIILVALLISAVFILPAISKNSSQENNLEEPKAKEVAVAIYRDGAMGGIGCSNL